MTLTECLGELLSYNANRGVEPPWWSVGVKVVVWEKDLSCYSRSFTFWPSIIFSCSTCVCLRFHSVDKSVAGGRRGGGGDREESLADFFMSNVSENSALSPCSFTRSFRMKWEWELFWLTLVAVANHGRCRLHHHSLSLSLTVRPLPLEGKLDKIFHPLGTFPPQKSLHSPSCRLQIYPSSFSYKHTHAHCHSPCSSFSSVCKVVERESERD